MKRPTPITCSAHVGAHLKQPNCYFVTAAVHYHVYEAVSAMTTGFRHRDQAIAHAARFRGSRVVDCELETCERFYGLRADDGSPAPRGPLTGSRLDVRA